MRWRALLLLACCLLPTLATAKEPSARDLEKLKGRIADVQRQLDSLRGEARTQEKALRDAEVAIGRLSAAIRDTESGIRTQERTLAALRTERDTLQRSRQQQETLLKAQLREAWQLGREKRLRVLFNQEHPATLARNMTWYRYFNEARATQILAFRNTITRLNAIEPELLATAGRLQAAHATLLEEQRALALRQAERKQVLAALQRDIRSTDASLGRLQRERSALEKLLQAVEDSITRMAMPDDALPFAKARGRLPWPVQGPIAQAYGSARGSGMRWQGVLIRAGSGTPVASIHHGRVVFADWFRGLGLLIIIDHGSEYLSLYAHNQSLLKEVGDWVSAGERIATVGASGGQADAGLYFEIRHQGKPDNPARWCRSS